MKVVGPLFHKVQVSNSLHSWHKPLYFFNDPTIVIYISFGGTVSTSLTYQCLDSSMVPSLDWEFSIWWDRLRAVLTALKPTLDYLDDN